MRFKKNFLLTFTASFYFLVPQFMRAIHQKNKKLKKLVDQNF